MAVLILYANRMYFYRLQKRSCARQQRCRRKEPRHVATLPRKINVFSLIFFQIIIISLYDSKHCWSYLKTGQYLPKTKHWDRLKIYFLMLQFLYCCIFSHMFLSGLHSQGWLIWKCIIIQVCVTSPISSEAWLQFVYCLGLNCVDWQIVPHFNHSGREEVYRKWSNR